MGLRENLTNELEEQERNVRNKAIADFLAEMEKWSLQIQSVRNKSAFFTIENIRDVAERLTCKDEVDDRTEEGLKKLKEYEESLCKYYDEGHGEFAHLLAEYQGFLDCLIALGFVSKESYALYVDEFRDKMKRLEWRNINV